MVHQKEKKLTESPSPLVGSRNAKEISFHQLPVLLLLLLFSVRITFFVATIAAVSADNKINISVNGAHCARR